MEIVRLGNPPSGHPSGSQVSQPRAAVRAPAQSRILIVDDERLLADTTADILRRAGFETKATYDAFGALEIMASFRADCLITDIVMPGMNGVELAIAITRMYPSTKIILFSGQADAAHILRETNAKRFEFPVLAKPIHPSTLIEELGSLNSKS